VRAGAEPAGLLLDRGFLGRVWAAEDRARDTRAYAHDRLKRRMIRIAPEAVAALEAHRDR
jgi:hypothetical protein